MGLVKDFKRKSQLQRVASDLNLAVNIASQLAQRIFSLEAKVKQVIEQNNLKLEVPKEEPKA